MTRTSLRTSAAVALALAGFGFVAPANAQQGAFLKRFDGTFSGSGSASRNETEKPLGVRCTMKSRSSDTSITMGGTCRAAVIFSRQIGASLRVDASGRYSGTYTGSSIGPAALNGRRQGDAVLLTITWPKEVRGDRTANMVIRNSGNGQLSIVITDQITKGGPVAQVSSMSLRKS